MPPLAVKASRKNLARPMEYAELLLTIRATRLARSYSWANFAMTGPWNGSMKNVRKM